VLRRKNFALFVGEEPGRLIECIKSEFRAEIERKGVELVECKGSVNLSPQYYSLLKVQDFILEALPDVSESIRSSEKYPKFKTSELRILTFKVHTSIIRYMLEDCADSLLRLGHKVRAVEMPRFGTLSQSFIRELGEEITKFKPDFVFTIDHIGIIPGLFSSLKLPYASWFVDHPFFWVTQEHLSESVSPYSVIFLWDRACIPELREFGFKKVFFLPLATNPRIFKKLSLTEEERKRYECNVSFVGSSTFDLSGVWNSYLREELRSPKIKSIIEEVIERQSENPLLSSREILMERLREHKCSLGRLLERESFEKILEFAAMAKYRKEIIEEVADFGLHLYGDRDWLRLLDKKVKFLGTINYLENLPKLYNASKINLSITMAQMKTTVNQRVYDVSACGAFVLSDYRRDLEELFEIDREVVFYRGKHDLREKVLYFLEHKAEREELSRRAQARVLRDHTYDVRMQQLTRIMQETFG
jgi:spore maturation protein CgeB